MLFSLSLILIIGFSLSGILNRFKIPGLIGLIFTGIFLGPQGLDLISPDILGISKDLREIALIVILLRAGLTLDLKDLKKVGRPALFMSFLPATFEITAVTLLAPLLLGITYIEALILGAVLSAVSPAVVVPWKADMERRNVFPRWCLPVPRWMTSMSSSSLRHSWGSTKGQR